MCCGKVNNEKVINQKDDYNNYNNKLLTRNVVTCYEHKTFKVNFVLLLSL